MPGGLVGRSQAATEADIAAGTLGGRGKRLVRVGVRRVNSVNMVFTAGGGKTSYPP